MNEGATTHNDSTELEIERIARENPDAVRQFAEKCDGPLKRCLLEVVDDVRGESA